MGKFLKAIFRVFAVLCMLAIFFCGGYYFGINQDENAQPVINDSDKFDFTLPGETEKRVVTVEEIEMKLVEIGELSTYSGEYTVTKSAEYSRYFLDDIKIPGTTNEITIQCTGVVKVGYDMNTITPTVDNDSMKIYLALPKAVIHDNYIIWDTVQCSTANNILNPLDFSQYQELISEIEAMGLEEAEKDGIYESANENVKMIICNFLSAFAEYEIVFI